MSTGTRASPLLLHMIFVLYTFIIIHNSVSIHINIIVYYIGCLFRDDSITVMSGVGSGDFTFSTATALYFIKKLKNKCLYVACARFFFGIANIGTLKYSV